MAVIAMGALLTLVIHRELETKEADKVTEVTVENLKASGWTVSEVYLDKDDVEP